MCSKGFFAANTPMSFACYKKNVLDRIFGSNSINSALAKKEINKILKIDKKNIDHDLHIQLGFEIANKLPENGKMLVALWERANPHMRRVIFDALNSQSYDNKELLLSVEVIKYRMGCYVDKYKIKSLLFEVNSKLKVKVVKILKFYGFFNEDKKYIVINEHIWNYWDVHAEDLHKINDDVFIRSAATKAFAGDSNDTNITIKFVDDRNGIQTRQFAYKKECKEDIQLIKDGMFGAFLSKRTGNCNLESYAHMCLGDYHNARKTLLNGLKHAQNAELYSLLVNQLLLLDRLAGICSVYPRMYIKINENWHQNMVERQMMFRENSDKYRDFKNYLVVTFDDFRMHINELNRFIYLFYCKHGKLIIYSFKENMSINTNIDMDEKLLRLHMLLTKSKETLKRTVTNPDQVKQWWSDRFRIDREIKQLLMFKLKCKFEKKCIICLDEKLVDFTFEKTLELSKCSVFRLSSSEYVLNNKHRHEYNALSICCIANGVNLSKTEERVANFAKQHNISTVMTNNTNVIAFFGHGSGIKYFQSYQPFMLLLFGCSSVKLIERKNFAKMGVPTQFLNVTPVIMGCLWDVTDYDIDVFGMCFIENIKNGKSIHASASEGIKCMRLKWLNGASIVVYSTLYDIE